LVAPLSEPPREAEAAPPSPGLSLEERRLAEKLLAQGERYLAQADVVSARLLFRRAAEGGLAMAAMRLAGTYDPVELSRLRTEGVAADEAEARKWYERARALGAPEAEDRLARLGKR
jgi:TPR repeat protein